MDNEIIRILKGSSGKWTPSYRNGEAIVSRVSYSIFPYFDKRQSRKVRRYLEKATHFRDSRKPGKSIKYYQKILVIIPYDNETKYDIAQVFLKTGDTKSACNVLQHCDEEDCAKLSQENCPAGK